MKSIRGEMLLAHGRQPRRRFSAAEKVAMLEESQEAGKSASAVARRYGVSPILIFQWRKLMKDGEMKDVEAEEKVMPESGSESPQKPHQRARKGAWPQGT